MNIALLPAPPAIYAVAIKRIACPTDVESLTPLLLRDLPSYTNRVMVRARGNAAVTNLRTVITAGRAEFAPLPIGNDLAPVDPNLQQLFFTTLERQRIGDRMAELQQYHWLFLAPTQTGWQLVLSYSRTAAYPSADQAVSPPRESSQGPIAQAVTLWLRDCQAGAVLAQN